MKLREKTTATLLIAIFMISAFAVVIPVSATDPVTNVDTSETFATIQAAIDDTDTLDGHTIIVAAGTYTVRQDDVPSAGKSVGIMIYKSLTVVSVEGAEATIIDAQLADMGVLINGDGTIATFDGFTVINYEVVGILAGAFGSWGEDPLEVNILNNVVEAPSPLVDAHNNNIQVGDGTTGTIIGNEVYGARLESPDWSGSGILVAGSSDVVISNNYVHNCEGGIQIVGYAEYRDAPSVNNIIESNLVEDCDTGISVQMNSIGTIIRYNDVLNNEGGISVYAMDSDTWGGGEHSAPSGTEIHLNNIIGNTVYGVKSSKWYDAGEVLAEEVDATLNWWGDATGPAHESNPHTTPMGDSVSDNVVFTPWYATSTTTPERQFVTVEHTGSSIIAYSDTIQGGIDAALSGDTISVATGTYVENVKVPPNKANLQLIGDGSSFTFIAPTSGRPVTLLGWVGPIDGFKIQGFTLVTPGALHAFLAGSGTPDGTTYTTNLILVDIVVDGGQRGIGLNALAGATFTDVHLSNIGGSPEAALELTGVSNLLFTEGSFEGNDIGVRLQPTGVGEVGEGYGANGDIEIHTSNFAGNGMAIENQEDTETGTTIDAILNYWGRGSGPTGPDGRTNKAGKEIGEGDPVSGLVYWDPYLPQPFFHTPHDPLPPGLD